MKTKTTVILGSIIILVVFMVGLKISSNLPARIATHWDFNGNPNGYSSKSFSVFFLPILTAFLMVLFTVIPMIDPKKRNIGEFRPIYNVFILGIVCFLSYIYLISMGLNLGWKLPMGLLLSPAIGGLFYLIGILMGSAKQNWFVGIRNPWTLESEEVWNKTHDLGSKLFKIDGIVVLLGVVFPKAIFPLILFAICVSVIVLTVYSYVEFKRLNNGSKSGSGPDA